MKRNRIAKGTALGLLISATIAASFLAGSYYSAGGLARVEQKSASGAGQQSRPADSNLYVKLESDGRRVIWIRASGPRTISKYDFSPDGTLEFKTQFRVDPNGKLLGGKVFNDRKIELYKISYGYMKTDGALAEERLYHARIAEGHPVGQPQTPIRRVIYSRDQAGSPLVSVLPPADSSQPLAKVQALPSPYSDQAILALSDGD